MAEAISVQPAPANVSVSRENDRSLLLAFEGAWTTDAQLPALSSVLSQVTGAVAPGETVRHVVLDGRDMSHWDTHFLVYLRKLCSELDKSGFELDARELPDGARRLLALARAVPAAKQTARSVERESLVVRIGQKVIDAVSTCGVFIDFFGQTVIATVRLLQRRAQFPVSEFAVIMQDAGVRALPIVSLIAILVGLIIAFVGSAQLQLFGAEIFTADMVAIAMLREMGAMMTAIIMAGRTGAAFAAEIATMQVNEEIDALATLGINPMEYLVLPRMLALSLMMPLLCLYANFMGILGGAVIGVTILDIPLFEYWTRTKGALSFTNLSIGLAKACVYGGLIALAGCLRGLQAGRSAAAVGVATTSAVVMAIVLIVAFDGLFAVILEILRI